jgi:hypothetical protein
MRRSSITLAVTALALVAAAPASADVTQNACLWSTHSRWEVQPIEWAGAATPNPVAPGSGANLTGASAHVRLPDWVTGYAEFFGVGVNELPTKVWMALAGDGTTQGVQVVALDTVARTTVTEHPDGSRSMTPIEVTVAVPDTAWTAGPTGTLAFRQAGPGTLPPVPGRSGLMVTPKGSVFISTATPLGVPIQLDCQPGAPTSDRTAVQATASAPFAAAPIQAGATPIPAPQPKPAVAVRSTKLKASGRKVKVSLSCTAANCTGAVTLKAGSKTLAPRKTYAIRSGARKTLTLTLSRTAQRSLKDKQSLKVTLRVTATGGKTITKKLTLR